MTTYKFATPLDWLEHHLDRIADGDEAVTSQPVTRLLFEAKQLARLLDSDQIQDEYQNLMDDDGYFDRGAMRARRSRS